MGKITCPHCGKSVESGSTYCPGCRSRLQKKSSVTPFLITGGFIVVIIVIVAVLLMPHGQPSGGIQQPQPTVPVPSAAAPVSNPPCTIAITGSKVLPSTINLQVMTSTCFSGDVTELSVSINGEKKGTLSSNPGTSGTFSGTSGSNNVIVVAKFSNGAESVVFQNPAL